MLPIHYTGKSAFDFSDLPFSSSSFGHDLPKRPRGPSPAASRGISSGTIAARPPLRFGGTWRPACTHGCTLAGSSQRGTQLLPLPRLDGGGCSETVLPVGPKLELVSSDAPANRSLERRPQHCRVGPPHESKQPMLFWTSRDANEWRKCRPPFFPQPTVDGSWTCGSRQTWRRRREDGNWEYRQEDDETEKTYCPQHCIALVPELNAADSHAIEQRREVHGCSTLR